ncbi:HGL095Wp [Eremothecium sinecaudum]|uniref:HGL095Wp n=1 Tax=Eremothecium sinecaudum TaxID=45286 RepID=A0A109V003_9SACH|nr:HGL095Wp [Eremothecium sinecaudum]AMD22245.1 HGL095Wp [Eremothecium sinecaudum]
MRLGKNIAYKSVPEWKLNSINYNKLKRDIKEVASSQNYGNDDELLCKLFESFQEQFRITNVFVCLKIRQVNARLVGIASKIVELNKANEIPAESTKFNATRLHLEYCSLELQQLSRYINLQRVALRKLTRKFKRYYWNKAVAKDFVLELNSCDELHYGQEGISFMNADLEPILAEISLLLRALINVGNGTIGYGDRELEYLLLEKTIVDTTVKSCLEFDALFLGKYHHLQTFVLAKDQVDDVKALLIKSGYHVVDKQDWQQLSQIENETDNGIPNSRQATKLDMGTLSTLPHSLLEMIPLDFAFAQDDKHNQHPSILLHGQGEDECVLMCHVGGMRGHICTKDLPLSTVLETLLQKQTEHDETSLSALDAMCLDWIKTHHLGMSDIIINTKRTRFFVRKQTIIGEEIHHTAYLIAIDENVTVNNELHLKHAFLEIRKLSSHVSPNKHDMPLIRICGYLLDNGIACCPIDPKHTLWNLGHQLKDSSQEFIDEEFCNIVSGQMSATALFNQGKEKMANIVEIQGQNHFTGKQAILLPPIDTRNDTLPVYGDWNHCNVEESAELNQIYGEDEHGGFIRFNRDFIEAFYHCLETLSFFFTHGPGKHSDQCEDAYEALLQPSPERNGSYATFDQSTSSSISPVHPMMYSTWDPEGLFHNEVGGEQLYAYKHDAVISIFYIVTLLMSCITTGATMGIIFSLFSVIGNGQTEFEGTVYITSLVLSSLVLSLVLSSFSLLLLFSRFKVAPWWHYTSCGAVFFLVTSCVCYGLVSLFI